MSMPAWPMRIAYRHSSTTPPLQPAEPAVQRRAGRGRWRPPQLSAALGDAVGPRLAAHGSASGAPWASVESAAGSPGRARRVAGSTERRSPAPEGVTGGRRRHRPRPRAGEHGRTRRAITDPWSLGGAYRHVVTRPHGWPPARPNRRAAPSGARAVAPPPLPLAFGDAVGPHLAAPRGRGPSATAAGERRARRTSTRAWPMRIAYRNSSATPTLQPAEPPRSAERARAVAPPQPGRPR